MRSPLGIALAAVLIAACGGASTSPASTQSSTSPFNVLVVAALSGPLSTTSIACTQGLKAAALVINREGGILGHKIQIQTFDDQGNATQGVNLLNQALNNGTTWNFAFAGGSSDDALAQMPTINKAKILNMASASATQLGDPKSFPYHFQTGVSPDLVAKFLVDYVATQHFKKVGLFTYDGAYGKSQNVSISKWLTTANIPFVNMQFSSTAIDLAPQLQQLQSQGVDAVVWSDLGAQIGYVIKSRAKLGWNIPFIGDTGVSSSDVYTLAGDPANLVNMTEDVYSIDIYKDVSKRSPAFRKFSDAVHEVAPTVPTAIHQYGECYDELQVIKVAAAQLKSLDADKLKTLLESNYKPPAGQLAVVSEGWGWSPTSHAPVNTPDEFAVIKVTPLVDGQYKG
jgi:branched-chain amino acid transport system substrate-binding protein